MVKTGWPLSWAQQHKVLTLSSVHTVGLTPLSLELRPCGALAILPWVGKRERAKCTLALKVPPGVVHTPVLPSTDHSITRPRERPREWGTTTYLKGLEALGQQHRGLPQIFCQVQNPRASINSMKILKNKKQNKTPKLFILLCRVPLLSL